MSLKVEFFLCFKFLNEKLLKNCISTKALGFVRKLHPQYFLTII